VVALPLERHWAWKHKESNVGYNCLVCVKQVPDTKRVTGEAMKDDGTVNRAALPAIFNPEDLNALELALAIRDQFGGTVTVVTMGLPSACEVLRESMFRGADRAVLLTDMKAAASDTLATSYILSCAARKFGADIVLCGRQAIDGDTAQVGPQLAEKLDFPLVTYVEDFMGVEDDRVKVKRNVGNGWEVVTAPVPCLMTVMETANVPRPAAARRMMKFKRAKSTSEVQKLAEHLLEGDFANSRPRKWKNTARAWKLRACSLSSSPWRIWMRTSPGAAEAAARPRSTRFSRSYSPVANIASSRPPTKASPSWCTNSSRITPLANANGFTKERP
jgi:electron transfer flavoprotein beta subunit